MCLRCHHMVSDRSNDNLTFLPPPTSYRRGGPNDPYETPDRPNPDCACHHRREHMDRDPMGSGATFLPTGAWRALVPAFGTAYLPALALFLWWFSFDAYAPMVFDEAGTIAAARGLVGGLAAIFGSVWRARQSSNATTYGSARWATQRISGMPAFSSLATLRSVASGATTFATMVPSMSWLSRRQPTITVRPGAPVRLLVSRDLILAPWRGSTGG